MTNFEVSLKIAVKAFLRSENKITLFVPLEVFFLKSIVIMKTVLSTGFAILCYL